MRRLKDKVAIVTGGGQGIGSKEGVRDFTEKCKPDFHKHVK